MNLDIDHNEARIVSATANHVVLEGEFAGALGLLPGREVVVILADDIGDEAVLAGRELVDDLQEERDTARAEVAGLVLRLDLVQALTHGLQPSDRVVVADLLEALDKPMRKQVDRG